MDFGYVRMQYILDNSKHFFLEVYFFLKHSWGPRLYDDCLFTIWQLFYVACPCHSETPPNDSKRTYPKSPLLSFSFIFYSSFSIVLHDLLILFLLCSYYYHLLSQFLSISICSLTTLSFIVYTALEFAERGLLTKIYPVMIGDKTIEETEGEPAVSYTNYFSSGCHPSSCKDIVVDAIEQRTNAHLDRQVMYDVPYLFISHHVTSQYTSLSLYYNALLQSW